MAKMSAGVLLYRHEDDGVRVMLVHPGGPFWAKKDKAAWSIPKGEVDGDEDNLTAAKREFGEETGGSLPDEGFIDLGDARASSNKVVHIWALEGNFDTTQLKSNSLEMAWPPKSGQMQSFPEVDKAAWFALSEAMVKIHAGQTVFIERLAEKLGVKLSLAKDLPGAVDEEADRPTQTSLF